MLRYVSSMLAVVAFLCGGLRADGLRAATAAPAMSGPGEYAVIRFIGNHSTRIAFGDGHIEYAATLLAGHETPSHVDPRMYQTLLLINLLARRGYEYAGKFDNGEQIVMKKTH